DGIRDRNVTGVQTCALPIYGYQFAYLSLDSPPKPDSEIGLTGGATLSGTASVGSSPVISVNTLSTAGRQVRPPQNPMPARVRSFNSRAEQSYFSAVSSNSFRDTSSHRQTTKSSTKKPPYAKLCYYIYNNYILTQNINKIVLLL